jgi:hypothetical protein
VEWRHLEAVRRHKQRAKKNKGCWTAIVVANPDAAGSARLIAESPALSFAPDELQVTT